MALIFFFSFLFFQDPKEPPPPPPPEKSWADEPSEVKHLTEETFKPFLKKKKHVLVMFYAPWCGHCKKAKPEITAAAEHYKDNSKVEYAAVDCTIERSVCSAYEVSGYPTLKYFQVRFNPKLAFCTKFHRLGLVVDFVIQAIGRSEFEDGLGPGSSGEVL